MLASEMVTEVRDHGFDDLTESRILSFLNDSYMDICAREPWPFLEKQATLVTNSSGVVTSPTDIQSVLSVFRPTDGGALTPQRLDDLTDRLGHTLDQAGTPKHYYFVGDEMRVWPVDASSNLTVNYIHMPPLLTTSPDIEPTLPRHIHRLLVTGALSKAAVMEDDPELAAVYTNMFETRLSQARSAMWLKQYDHPQTIKDLFWEDDADGVWY